MSRRAKILGNLLSFHILIILLKNIHTLKRRRFYPMWNLCQTFHAMGDHRRCAHSDCVAHGRKTKSESFASCRVNISGGSKIAWINVECNEDSQSVAVPSKVKKSSQACATLVILPWQIRCSEATDEIQIESKLQPCPRIYSFGSSHTHSRWLCE